MQFCRIVVQYKHQECKGGYNMPNQERLRETKHHGAVRFPFNIYPCTIPGDFLQVPLHWHDSMELVYVKKAAESCRSV